MPHIDKSDRLKFNRILGLLPQMLNKAELEYVIFAVMMRYKADRNFRYDPLHDIVYSAHHCGDEFRRLFLDKREDSAIAKNGIAGSVVSLVTEEDK